MTDQAEKIGVMSLRLAVAGIILPIILGIVFVVLQDARVIPSAESYVGLCVLLFLGCQLSAFITGRPSKNTPSGRIGFRIGAWSLVLFGILFLFAAGTWCLKTANDTEVSKGLHRTR